MVEVKKEGIILRKTNLSFENDAVLNPAVIKEGNSGHLFYRAVRKGNHSSIGYCKLEGPINVKERSTEPVLTSQFEYESQGLEDPRIVKIDDLYYLTYTAFDGVNALGSLATSKDLKQFDKQGVIVPKISHKDFKRIAESKNKLTNKYFSMNQPNGLLMDKDVVFFPRRIDGRLCFLHRIKPDIQIVSVKDLSELTNEFWENYILNLDEHILMTPRYTQELSYVGGGCPPIETKDGWLLIYHGVQETDDGYLYSARAALLDLEDPQKEIARLPYRLFIPELEYELSGAVDKVCFPTGTALFDDTLYIYYGAADEQIACASLSISALLTELQLYSQKNEFNLNKDFQSDKDFDQKNLYKNMQNIVKIKSISHVTHDVLRINTEKPADHIFTPGQATEISINKSGWQNETRPFTFTCLPGDDHLQFTIKTYPSRKGVTNELLSLKRDDELILHDVFGAIYYKGEGVFIAGGAGVTPFIAILRYLHSNGKIGENKLIFSNKTMADIILKEEFESMLGKNFINILSEEKTENYPQGHITEDFLKENLQDLKKYFYLCGPPPMMEAVEKQLSNLKIESNLIVKEEL